MDQTMVANTPPAASKDESLSYCTFHPEIRTTCPPYYTSHIVSIQSIENSWLMTFWDEAPRKPAVRCSTWGRIPVFSFILSAYALTHTYKCCYWSSRAAKRPFLFLPLLGVSLQFFSHSSRYRKNPLKSKCNNMPSHLVKEELTIRTPSWRFLPSHAKGVGGVIPIL